MTKSMHSRDDGAAIDEALGTAFADAIRAHREANVPMAVWEDGHVRLVSPFSIPLPGEAAPDEADDAQPSRKRAGGGD